MELAIYLKDALLNTLLLLGAGLLPWCIFALLMQLLSGQLSKKLIRLLGEKTFICLTAPGVIAHELGHAFFCILFGHKITDMKLFTMSEGDTLGYVSHSYDPDNIYHKIGNFFIGTGPVWFGATLLTLLSLWLLPESMVQQDGDLKAQLINFIKGFGVKEFWCAWQSWLWLYLSLTIVSQITLSEPDLKHTGPGLCMIFLLTLSLCIGFGWCGDWERPAAVFLFSIFLTLLPVLVIIALMMLVALLIF